MKYIFPLLLAACTALASDVQFSLGDFTSRPQAARVFALYPVGVPVTNNAGQIVTRDRFSTNTTASGVVNVSNVVGGSYRSELIGAYATTTNYFIFPVTNGFLNAVDYLAVATNGPAGGHVAYSQTQSDARFWAKAGLLAGTNAYFRTNAGVVYIDGAAGGSTLNTNTVQAIVVDMGVVTNGAAEMTLSSALGAAINLHSDSEQSVLGWGPLAGWTFTGTATNSLRAQSFIGDGSGVTNLHGTNIQAGTINSNKLDAATWLAAANRGIGPNFGYRLDWSTNKVVVLEGSSTMAGGNVTNDNAKLHLRLKNYFTNNGWTVHHLATGTTDTSSSVLNRFYTDVVPKKPTLVILCLAGNDYTSYTNVVSMLANIWQYAQACRSYGIQLCITKQFPSQDNSSLSESVKRRFDDEVESWGIPVVDMASPVNDRNGLDNIVSGYRTGADVHGNEGAHTNYFLAFPMRLFDPYRLNEWTQMEKKIRTRSMINSGVVLQTNTGAGVVPLYYNAPTNTYKSFTFGVWWRSTLPINRSSGAIIAVSNAWYEAGSAMGWASRLYIGSTLTYQSGAGATHNGGPSSSFSGYTESDWWVTRWHHYCLVHSDPLGKTYIYIDGNLLPTDFSERFKDPEFFLGGRGDAGAANYNCEYRDAVVYKVPLLTSQVRELARNNYPLASLEVFAPLDDKLYGTSSVMTNFVPIADGFKPGSITGLTNYSGSLLSQEIVSEKQMTGLSTNYAVPGGITLYFTNGVLMKAQ